MVARRVRYKHCIEDVDRHGNVRVYFRPPGEKKQRIRATPGTPEFDRIHAALLTGEPTTLGGDTTEKVLSSVGAKSDTLRWLVIQYLKSPEFRRLKAITRARRSSILERICLMPHPSTGDMFGTKLFSGMRPKHIRNYFRDHDIHHPEAGNGMVKALRQLFQFAISEELADNNPAKDVPYLRSGSTGFHTWTIEEVNQYRARHPIGTKARLAMDLLLFTGQRRSDIVTFGRQHGKESITFTQFKNRDRKPITLTIPILPPLRKSIDAAPTGDLTYLVTIFNKPFTSNGFGNWFKDRCVEADLRHCSAHGLRKAGATFAAENGATERQLMSMFGWTDSKQPTKYTRAANQKLIASGSMNLLIPAQTENEKVPLLGERGE
jgi:integrase